MDSADRLVAGRYRLRARLGSGGMGTVWRAQDVLLGRDVAVKEVVFPPGTRPEDAEVLRERTRREARAAARLDSPSAVTVYDVVEEDGRPWLVMELVEARTLAQVIADGGPLSPGRTARVGLSVLDALEAAHAAGILHRDVKPANVLVRDDGRVVLTDFGIATSTGDASLTSSGLLLGSPAYIAPERAQGQTAGPASDLWSLGATLFTAVEGRPPYDAEGDAFLTVTAVVTGQHAPYAAAGPLVPVLDGLLEKDPGRRLDAPRARALLAQVAAGDPLDREATRALPVPGAGQRGSTTTALPLVDPALVDPALVDPAATAAAPLVGRPPLDRPAPPVRRQRSRVPAVAGGALLLALLGAGGVAALRAADGDPAAVAGATAAPTSASPRPSPTAGRTPTAPATSASPSPTPSRTASPTPSPTPSPTSSPTSSPTASAPASPTAGTAAGVPAGWASYPLPADRWTVSVPPGYASRGGGEFRDATTGRTLRIESGPGEQDAVGNRERQAASFAKNHPSYEEVGIEQADYRGYPAADWEFTYSGLHVLNRVFVVDGKGHSLYFQTRASDWPAARADFDRIAAAVRTTG